MAADTVTIGNNARRAREYNGFSQANAAIFLKVDQSLISKFESGVRSINADMLERLANLYGYKAADFENEAGLPAQRIQTAFRSGRMSADDLQVIHDIKRIAMNLFFMTELAGGNKNEG